MRQRWGPYRVYLPTCTWAEYSQMEVRKATVLRTVYELVLVSVFQHRQWGVHEAGLQGDQVHRDAIKVWPRHPVPLWLVLPSLNLNAMLLSCDPLVHIFIKPKCFHMYTTLWPRFSNNSNYKILPRTTWGSPTNTQWMYNHLKGNKWTACSRR